MYILKDILKTVDGTGNFDADLFASGVSIDSRTVKNGEIFIAIKGENCDGHEFIDKAFKNGAVAVIAEKNPENHPNIIVVKDSFKALWDIAKYNRERTKAKIIGITGSVGKTGTKELLTLGLSHYHKVYSTKGNLNNHFGLPLCLANMPPDTEYGIFELGMSAAGEIEELSLLLQPHISIITAIAPAHLEHFACVNDIALAKAEIVSGTSDFVILPADSEYFETLKNNCGDLPIISFGKNPDADVHYFTKDSEIHANIKGEEATYEMSTQGNHWVVNSLSVLAVAHIIGDDVQKIASRLKQFQEPEGRGKIHQIPISGGKFTLIDDSYNANPISMEAAIEKLHLVHGDSNGRKIAILGDMLELGKNSIPLHIELGQVILNNKVDQVFTIGKDIEYLQEILPENISAGHWNDLDELTRNFLLLVRPDDTVLVKGSNGVGVYKIAKTLINIKQETL